MVSQSHFRMLFIVLFLYFPTCFSLPEPTIVFLNTKETYTLKNDDPLTLQISGTLISSIGTINVIVTPVDSQASAFVVLSRQQCEGWFEPSDLPFDQLTYKQGSSAITFVGNTSQANCFRLEFIRSTQHTVLNYTVEITFSPIDIILEIGKSQNFEIRNETEKEFGFKYDQYPVQVIKITIQDEKGPIKKTPNFIPFQIRQFHGSCLESQSEMSWLCYLFTQKGLLKFSLYSPHITENSQILVTEIGPEKINPDTASLITSSIPGFGSLFSVSLHAVGILKVRAKNTKGKYLPLFGGSSLFNLFGSIGQEPTDMAYMDTSSNDGDALIIQNKHSNMEWFYLIQETKPKETFFLTSSFLKQAILEVGEQAVYYIDPDLYQYQHIELRLGVREFPEKYEVYVQAEAPESLMNLYFDTNSYDIGYSLFPDDHLYRKRASPVAIKDGELYLSFIVGGHDTSAYLSIQALQKGFYSIKVSRIESRNVWEGVFIVTLITCMIAYLFSCLAKVFNMSKSNDFAEFPEWPELDRVVTPSTSSEGSNGVDLEANIPEMPAPSPINEVRVTREVLPRLIRMMKKLKRQHRIERKERQAKKEENEAKDGENKDEINEEEACDICYETKKTVTFEPCGHKCTCAFCALIIVQTSTKCPMCRGQINKVQVCRNVQIAKDVKVEEKEKKNTE